MKKEEEEKLVIRMTNAGKKCDLIGEGRCTSKSGRIIPPVLFKALQIFEQSQSQNLASLKKKLTKFERST